MHDLYVKLMSYLLGQALGNSDRIKVAVAGAVSTALMYLVAHCGPCAVILTPDVLTHLTIVITAYVLTLVYSIGNRDTLTPAQEAAKAAASPAQLSTAILKQTTVPAPVPEAVVLPVPPPLLPVPPQVVPPIRNNV